MDDGDVEILASAHRGDTWPGNGSDIVAAIVDMDGLTLFPEIGASWPDFTVRAIADWEASYRNICGRRWNEWIQRRGEEFSGYHGQVTPDLVEILNYSLPQALQKRVLPVPHPLFGDLPLRSGHNDVLEDLIALIVGSRAIFGQRDSRDPIEQLLSILRCGALPCGFADGETPTVFCAFAPTWRERDGLPA